MLDNATKTEKKKLQGRVAVKAVRQRRYLALAMQQQLQGRVAVKAVRLFQFQS